jgi:hypothetical protein
MPAATTPAWRQRLLELHRAGLDPPPSARPLSLPPRTVRRLVALDHQLIEVGRERAGTWVCVGLDAEGVEWVS